MKKIRYCINVFWVSLFEILNEPSKIIIVLTLLLVTACYDSSLRVITSSDVSNESDFLIENEDGNDFVSEYPWDDLGDFLPDQDLDALEITDEEDSRDDHEGEVPSVLIPEGPEILYPTDTGRYIRPTYSSMAFSGIVYSLLLIDEQTYTSRDPIGVFRLATGGEFLETRWISSIPGGPDSAGLCWSGETFTAAFAMVGNGIQYISIHEDGTLAQPLQLLIDDPEDELDAFRGNYPLVACPMGGPVVIDMRQTEEGFERLFLYQNSGIYDNRFIDISLTTRLADNYGYPPCTTVENEVACICDIENTDDVGILFIDRDGQQRYSEPLPGDISLVNFMMSGSTITKMGDYIAVIGIIVETEENKNRLLYALYDRVGRLIVPPVSSFQVGSNVYGMQSASSGMNILVQAPGLGEEHRAPPYLYLLDTAGRALGASNLSTEPWLESHNVTIGVFWEGDAYAVLWTKVEGVMYRRFRVE